MFNAVGLMDNRKRNMFDKMRVVYKMSNIPPLTLMIMNDSGNRIASEHVQRQFNRLNDMRLSD